MEDLSQLNVSLEFSKPPIWRQIQVRKDTTFFELYHILQITMGWKYSHLHEFNCDGYRIGEINEEFSMEGFGSDEVTDSQTVTINDIILKVNEPFRYTYDSVIRGIISCILKNHYQPIQTGDILYVLPERCHAHRKTVEEYSLIIKILKF